jgi:2-oxoglutarate dehydrogenase E2 component (dihydrolipoamide succinyltransferase)
MSIEVKVPAAGESVTSANVARWHAPHGSSVRKGTVIVTLETDKVSTELEAPADGTLEVLAQEGSEVPVGSVIARISAETSVTPPPAVPAAASTAPAPAPAPAPPAAAAPGAPLELKVPPSGESVTSATVAAWRKKDGETVAPGDVVVVLETDKVSNELEAPAAGTLEVLVSEGSEVPIGTLIARILPTSGAKTAATPAPPAPPAAAPAPATAPKTAPPSVQPPAPAPAPETTLAADRSPSAPVREGRSTRRKMSMLRRKIAAQLVGAQQTAAILTTFNEVDMSAVMELRKAVQDDFTRKHGVKLGFMSFFVKAVVQALRDIPSINARIEGNDIIDNHYYDIGVAIGTDKGLFVPVLRDCDAKSFAGIEKDIADYAAKAREGRITIEDMQGGVFSISNGGTYGSLLSTPILNPPQSGILGMHTIQQRPVAVNGKVEIRPMMYLALSYDHRLVDGKEAVTFLIRIKESIESPSRLLLEM